MDVYIRGALEGDIVSIVGLGKQLLHLHSSFDGGYYQLEEDFDNQFSSWVKNQLNSHFQFIIVAIDENNQVVGFISGFLKNLYPWFKVKTVGHISYLVVDPTVRNKGIGKLLEDAAGQWFKKNNISYIEVYVDEKNEMGKKVWSAYQFMPFKQFLRKRI